MRGAVLLLLAGLVAASCTDGRATPPGPTTAGPTTTTPPAPGAPGHTSGVPTGTPTGSGQNPGPLNAIPSCDGRAKGKGLRPRPAGGCTETPGSGPRVLECKAGPS